MAASFNIVSQVRGVRVLGPTHVEDVEIVGYVTHPTGIYAEWPVPYNLWRQGLAGEDIQILADAIEALIQQGPAITGSYVQDLDANGLLVDYIEFVVEYVPPEGVRAAQTTTVLVREAALLRGRGEFLPGEAAPPESLILEAYNALATTAGL